MKPLSTYKAVIFDFDGTLYDNSHIGRCLVLSHPFSFFYMKAERDTRRSLKGRDIETPQKFKYEYCKRAAKHLGTSPEIFARWFEEKYLKYLESALRKKRFQAREQIAEVFNALVSSGKKIALYSDYERIQARALACGVPQEALDLCSGFYSPRDFGCLKPAPRAFLQIASDLSARPKDCLVVGDRDDTDGMGARLSEMQFIQIKTKSPKDVLHFNHQVMEWKDFAAAVLNGSLQA